MIAENELHIIVKYTPLPGIQSYLIILGLKAI